MRKVFAAVIFFFFVLLCALTYISREFLLPKESERKTTRVVISRGVSADEIAQALDEQGLIRHVWSFRLLTRFTNTGKKIVAGTYDLSPSSSEYEILRLLIRGQGVLVRVTIPEGYDLKQIAGLLGSKNVVPPDQFLARARGAEFDLPEAGLQTKGVEGFLFPDTYEVEPHISPDQAMEPMLRRFKELVIPLYLNAKSRLSLREVITLASMIEKEGKIQKEFPLISSVYCNRLKDGIPLQCDATLQYLLPAPREILTSEDLKIDSPYNTYLHSGLPPGPIGSPGLAAIKAALNPARTSYRYYVLEGSDGRHAFSATYREHLRSVERYSHWLKSR